MIKITVNSAVYAALSLSFPKPTNSAHRALAKYISALEAMLFKSLHFAATPLQRKLDLFAISLQQLANQGGQIGPKKLRVHPWLRNNNLNLVEPVILGTSQSKEVSQCRLTSLVTMVDTVAVEDKILILHLFSVLLKPPIIRTSCLAAGPLSSVAQTSSG